MMKKIVIAAAAALIATGASAAYKDGTYTGVAQGRASQIEVAVTVKAGKIAGVKVTKHGDTPMLCDAAADEIIFSMKNKKVAQTLQENEKA